jgi:glycogen phosphorylase
MAVSGKLAGADTVSKLVAQYVSEPTAFTGSEEALYERHLLFDNIVDPESISLRERFEAVARSVRDLLSQRWIRTEQSYDRKNPKRIYYISIEFLLGRSLANNIENLQLDPIAKQLIKDKKLDWLGLLEQEPDPGLGSGGLGRLAACFLDSMATMQLPATGYGLRYEYGMFHQSIRDGAQQERPDHWLRRPDPWQISRPQDAVEVKLNCSFKITGGGLHAEVGKPSSLFGIPRDLPIVGYGGQTINSLRLWVAAAPDYFDFQEFSRGDFIGALAEKLAAETLTRVLYPDDSTSLGQGLRFVQEYFLVACSLADIIRQFRRANADWTALPEKVAIQLNDTHPTMAVPELMRILLDDAKLGWDQAWDLTRRTLAYTNHTLLPEALEKWPVAWFEMLIPRNLEIIFEINRRLLDEVRTRYPGDEGRVARVSLIEEGPHKHVRMANLAIVGSHSTNGVAAIHSRLLRTTTVKDLAEIFPERFNNKTNGVTPRRWLLLANPAMAHTITDAIGDGWITDLSQLIRLKPLAADKAFRDGFLKAKREAKSRFAAWLKSKSGITVDPGAIFDCQIKRIHEYKRQLLNILEAIALYQAIKDEPQRDWVPRVKIFAGKAAASYRYAKLIIKLINDVAEIVNNDAAIGGRLKIAFLADYNVSLAEVIIPAADLSEQISTAGMEASGTGNMKLALNGALTIGTLDGANIEIRDHVGPENIAIFGMEALDVLERRRHGLDATDIINRSPRLRRAIDSIERGDFSPDDPRRFESIAHALRHLDHYMVSADFDSYYEAQRGIDARWQVVPAWTRASILNVARMGWFSSDRTIREYAEDIWNVPVPDTPPGLQTPAAQRGGSR